MDNQTISKQKEEQKNVSLQMNDNLQDWVTVQSEETFSDKYKKLTLVEGISKDSEQAQKVLDSFGFFTPVKLTKKELSGKTDEDKTLSDVNIDSLETMSYDKLTDWALANAKVEGANPGFVKLVEAMMHVKDMQSAFSYDIKENELYDYRKQLDIGIGDMKTCAGEYFRTHNSFFIFRKKGRMRIKLCNILLGENNSGGMIDKLRLEADKRVSKMLFAYEYENAFTGRLDSYKKNERYNEIHEVEKNVCLGGHHNRFPFKQLFKDSLKAKGKTLEENVKWNNELVDAILALGVKDGEGSNEKLKKMVDRRITEIADYRLSGDMLEEAYISNHPEVIEELRYIAEISGDLISKANFKPIVSGIFDEISKEKPEKYKLFQDKSAFLILLHSFMQESVGLNPGVKLMSYENYLTGNGKKADALASSAVEEDELDDYRTLKETMSIEIEKFIN